MASRRRVRLDNPPCVVRFRLMLKNRSAVSHAEPPVGRAVGLVARDVSSAPLGVKSPKSNGTVVCVVSCLWRCRNGRQRQGWEGVDGGPVKFMRKCVRALKGDETKS